MLVIIEIPGRKFNTYEINVVQEEHLCGKRGFNDKVDCLITSLKGTGLTSPKLCSLTKATGAKALLYELRLPLFRSKEGAPHE
jgi:hypothetical protein